MLDYTAHRLPETGKKLSRCKVVKKKKKKNPGFSHLADSSPLSTGREALTHTTCSILERHSYNGAQNQGKSEVSTTPFSS